MSTERSFGAPLMQTNWLAAAVVLLALAVGLGLRLHAMTSAYWFDEIWSTSYALAASSIAELYAHAHDNNHLLSTFAIHWIGPREDWLAYRALAFATGLAVLGLAVFERGRTSTERAVRAVLLASSPLLVLLSSEARGYAPALAAALGALAMLRRRLESSGFGSLVGFGVLLPLGLLSHLVFVHFYIAAFVYAATVLHSRGVARTAILRELALLFAVPGLLAVLHGVFFVLPMETGGSGAGLLVVRAALPDFGVAKFAARLFAFTFGVPEWGWPGALLAAIGAGMFAIQLDAARRAGAGRWVFDLMIVIVSPVVLLSLFAPGVIAVRYFALQILFFLLAFSDRLAAWIDRSGAARVAALALLLAILAGNAMSHLAFAQLGRGQYLEALHAMAASQPGDAEVRIAADHTSRARLLVEFYARFVDRPIRFVLRREMAELEPDWFIVQGVPAREAASPRIGVRGRPYRFFARYDFAYLSGFRWDVYRFEPPEPAEPAVSE